jgi:mycobactin phenyloxazoline synthetase
VVNSWGADCPDWVTGELWIGGRGIARGYRGRPDLTADRFVEHAARRWYRTGDLGRYWPDGTVEFVGRADHRVKISGYRIELGDVEVALQRVPGVRAAAAAIVFAPGGEMLAALVGADNPSLTESEVRERAAKRLPPHMIPRYIRFTDAIPFTVGGKTDRRAVVQILTDALNGDPSGHRRAPSSPLESALAAIVAELVDGQVGVDDDFFELGGDSVLATVAVARIRNWLDTSTVMVPDIFATRTVSALARRLAEREPPGSPRLEQVAELFLEVTDMDSADVMSALDTAQTA